MLIGTRFKRPKAPIELPGKTYFFTPRNPAEPESEHVCEVENTAHIQMLLAITEGYYIAEDQPSAKRPVPQPPAPTPPADPPAPPAGQTQVEGDGGDVGEQPAGSNGVIPLDGDQLQAAQRLNELSFQNLSAELKKGGIPEQIVREALRIEEAKPEDDQRSTTLKALKKHLGVK